MHYSYQNVCVPNDMKSHLRVVVRDAQCKPESKGYWLALVIPMIWVLLWWILGQPHGYINPVDKSCQVCYVVFCNKVLLIATTYQTSRDVQKYMSLFFSMYSCCTGI